MKFSTSFTKSIQFLWVALLTLTTSVVSAQAPYCSPSYSNGTGSGDFISLVSIGGTTLNNPSSGAGAPYYTLYPASGATTGTINAGSSYTISVAGGTYSNCYIGVWIDFNQDNDFADAGEYVGGSGQAGAQATSTIAMAVPATALAGTTRMRVRSDDAVSAPTDPCGGLVWGETEDYVVTVVNSACTGTPTPGNAVSSVTTVCPATNFTLSLLGAPSGTGLTFAWQKSVDGGGSWSATTGTTSSYVTQQSVATSYRCIVTCTTSSETAVSGTVAVAANSFLGCYCASAATSTADEEILNVTFNALNNSSTCATTAPGPGSILNRYSNYTTLPATTAMRGIVNNFSVQGGTCGGNFTNRIAIFIDLNQDGTFTTDERLFQSTAVAGANTQTGTIIIPTTAMLGTTLLRVVQVETTGDINGCGTYTWGETEDYLLNIIQPTDCAGTPDAGNTISSVTSTCANTNFTLSLQNQLSVSGITYQWQLSTNDGGSWATIANANSPSYVAQQTVATSYRCLVGCTPSGEAAATPAVAVPMSPAYLCTCASVATSTFYHEIYNTTVGTTLNKTSTCTTVAPGPGSIASRYANYRTETPTTQLIGVATPVSLTLGVDCQAVFNTNHAAKIYIDLNRNGSFTDAGEMVFQTAQYTSANTGTKIASGSLFIPATTTPGVTAMRVVYQNNLLATIAPCNTYTYGETEDYLVDLMVPPACSAAPTLGATTASATSVCPSVSFSLGNASLPLESGISYQWQNSTDGGGSWNNISGATAPSYATSQTIASSYRLMATCDAVSASTAATPATVALNSFLNCYCSSAATSTADEDLGSVAVGGVSNTTACGAVGGAGSTASLYNNYKGLAPGTIYQGISNSFSAASITCGGSFGNRIAIFIDFNQNGSFTDAGENVWLGPVVTGPHTDAGSFAVPSTATIGQTVMRVIVVETTGTISPCGTYTWGETEDYLINVAPAPPCTPPTAASASNLSTNTATINWTCTNCTGTFNIEYGPAGFAQGTGTTITNVTSPYTITGLSGLTNYHVYIKRDCGAPDGLAPAYGPVAFKTSIDCNAGTVLTCGGSATFTMPTGTGEWTRTVFATNGSTTTVGTGGKEVIFRYTSPATGVATLTVGGTASPFVMSFYKPVSGGCNNDNWNQIIAITAPNVIGAGEGGTFPVVAGQEYYIMFDGNSTTAAYAARTISVTTNAAFYIDQDGDGFAGSFQQTACGLVPDPIGSLTWTPGFPQGYLSSTGQVQTGLFWQDCADNSFSNPLAPLIYSAYATVYVKDTDGDGYGAGANRSGQQIGVSGCGIPSGWLLFSVNPGTDCDSLDNTIYPGATETCNLKDDDCDGLVDDGVQTAFYIDADGDTYGDPTSSPVLACAGQTGYAANADDCDDTNAAINPVTFWYLDFDADGYGYDYGEGLTVQSCTDPGGYSIFSNDCNDFDVLINPATNWYVDGDGDTYGAGTATVQCEQPSGSVLDNTDCDDTNAAVNPATMWYTDADADGHGDPNSTPVVQCATVSGASYIADDCNDSNNTIYTGATELCDGLDNDCNTVIDDDLGAQDFYVDSDNDGFGDPNAPTVYACIVPPGYADDNTDCNDADQYTYPGAPEQADDQDNDCDGQTDEFTGTCQAPNEIIPVNITDESATVTWAAMVGATKYRLYWRALDNNPNNAVSVTTLNAVTSFGLEGLMANTRYRVTIQAKCGASAWTNINLTASSDTFRTYNKYWVDADGDTYGSSTVVYAYAIAAGLVTNSSDCDDNNAAAYPGNSEVCDAADNDCNGSADDGLTFTTVYNDVDADGFGDDATVVTTCSPASGTVMVGGDCNDNDAAVRPDATEVCNDIDDNCNGSTDDGLTFTTVYNDVDMDTYGDDATAVNTCNPASGTVTVGGDCDDSNAGISPAATEVCDVNGKDEDCDGANDDYATCPEVSAIYFSNVSLTSATVSFDPIPCAQSYTVRYRTNLGGGNFGPWSTVALDAMTTSTDLTGLDELTRYQVRVFTQCANGTTSESFAINSFVTFTTWYADNDGDGFGDAGVTTILDSLPVGFVDNDDDCDDNDMGAYPGAAEACDGVDNNCDGSIDENVGLTFYADADGDTYGDAAVTTVACSAPSGFVGNNSDCNDTDASVNPMGAETVCNGIDNDCDGAIDEGVVATTCPAPASLNVSNVGTTTATVGWGLVPCASSGYRIMYRPAVQALVAWTYQNVAAGSSSDGLSLLTPGSKYLWKVRANCATGFSTSTTGPAFTMLTSLAANTPEVTSATTAEGVTVFPNPTRSELNVNVNGFDTESTTMTILDASGRVVMQQNLSAQGVHTFDVSSFVTGIYMIRVQGGDRVEVKTFIRE